ncbi:MAG: hypothetical protein H6729_17150 [Deltaproteobacteria bacterium]|nr:hypothetical protein [Deltaproteobacteria bacterium]
MRFETEHLAQASSFLAPSFSTSSLSVAAWRDRFWALCVLCLFPVAGAACSGGSEREAGAPLVSPDASVVGPILDGSPSLGEDGCRGLTDCGWSCGGQSQPGCGESNAVSILSCDHCPRRADAQVCEAGTCRDVSVNPGGLVRVLPTIPEGLDSIQAAIVATVLPTMADGTRVMCERLLTGATLQDVGLNVVNVRVLPVVVEPPLVPSLSLLTEPGPDQLVVVLLVDDERGAGQVLAQGCREGVEVSEGGKTTVGMDCARP